MRSRGSLIVWLVCFENLMHRHTQVDRVDRPEGEAEAQEETRTLEETDMEERLRTTGAEDYSIRWRGTGSRVSSRSVRALTLAVSRSKRLTTNLP